MEYNNQIPIGTIIAFKGLIEPENWIFCDGIPRIYNKDYDNLINFEIGILDKDKYIPPNYDDSVLSKVNDTYNDKIQLLLLANKKMIQELEICHVYIHNNIFQTNYNNKYFSNDDKNYEEYNCEIIENNIKWIIKYK